MRQGDTQADLTEREPFDITESDIGRYVRRRSTGFVGLIVRDPGNGWLHPDLYYEWKAIRDELEYVTVLNEAALQSEREAAAAEAVAQYQQKLMYLADAIKTLDKALATLPVADVASPPAGGRDASHTANHYLPEMRGDGDGVRVLRARLSRQWRRGV